MSTVQSLTSEHMGSAAVLLADSFYDNPAHIYICPNDDNRLSNLRWLLGANLKLQPGLSSSFCMIESQQVQAMGFWTSSSASAVSALRKVQAGILLAPFRLGISGVRRLAEVTSEIDRHCRLGLGSKPYWYLNNMVIAHNLRGRGVGTRLLGEQLSGLDSKTPQRSVALATQRPQNVSFYSRMGFAVVWEEEIGSGDNKFTNWIMERPVAA